MNQLIEPVLTKMYWLESSENYKRLLKVKDHSRMQTKRGQYRNNNEHNTK